MLYLRTSLLALVASMATATFASAEQGQEAIVIYSSDADPNNPIVINSPAQFEVTASSKKTAVIHSAQIVTPDIAESSLNGAEALSQEELEAMARIFKTIEEANEIEEIQTDDPLSGLSPDQRAFFEAMQGVIPMTDAQIRLFKERYHTSKQATLEPVKEDAQRSSRSIDLTLKPGEEVPTIRMQPGKVATMTFSDRNGNAWPILSVTTGDATAFAAETAGEQGVSNILVVNPRLEHASSNMVVTLVDNPVPILLTLDGRNQTVIDYRTDIRVDAKGPNSDYAITSSNSLSPTGDSTMIAFLDGIPPRGAQKKSVSGSPAEAWVYQEQLYIRTRGEVLSPAYVAKSTNVSGISVFVMPETPVLIISEDGVMNPVTVNQ